jgi:hypothetical protein
MYFPAFAARHDVYRTKGYPRYHYKDGLSDADHLLAYIQKHGLFYKEYEILPVQSTVNPDLTGYALVHDGMHSYFIAGKRKDVPMPIAVGHYNDGILDEDHYIGIEHLKPEPATSIDNLDVPNEPEIEQEPATYVGNFDVPNNPNPEPEPEPEPEPATFIGNFDVPNVTYEAMKALQPTEIADAGGEVYDTYPKTTKRDYFESGSIVFEPVDTGINFFFGKDEIIPSEEDEGTINDEMSDTDELMEVAKDPATTEVPPYNRD